MGVLIISQHRADLFLSPSDYIMATDIYRSSAKLSPLDGTLVAWDDTKFRSGMKKILGEQGLDDFIQTATRTRIEFLASDLVQSEVSLTIIDKR